MTYDMEDYYKPITEKNRPSQQAIDKQLQNMLCNANSVNYIVGVDTSNVKDESAYVVYDNGVLLYSGRHKFRFWWWVKRFFLKLK